LLVYWPCNTLNRNMKKEEINIFWLRRDLRLDDNNALLQSLKSGKKTLLVFIFDKYVLSKIESESDKRVNFIHQSLQSLNKELSKFNSSLLVKHGDIKQQWKEIINDFNVSDVYFNEDYTPYARKRDKEVTSLLKKNNITVHSHLDQCIFHPTNIVKKDGSPYTVFNYYKKKWMSQIGPNQICSYNNKKFFNNFFKFKCSLPSLKDIGFTTSEIKINKVLPVQKIKSYEITRNIPSLNGTSMLSVHIRFGTISIRRCVQIALNTSETWLSELIWREFFMQILYHFPHVTNSPFKDKYKAIKWSNNRDDFEKWKNGKTGFPIVDAGMRELNETGFMHNRVRMIVASFLVKDLLIDWRWGERYFAEKLIDYDLSANNGNWQWVAGTGCDAAPYFRIFNPYTQTKKFDPDLTYIKKWIPEYDTNRYPKEMIDHNQAYHRAIKRYKDALK